VQVPREICAELEGEPEVGREDEPVHLLLTTDDGDAPYVCLLSRAQLEAAGNTIRAVVYSSGTRANLDRKGVATLVVVTNGVAHYCTLAVQRQVSDGALAGYALELRSHRRDEVPGADLRAMHYTVTEEMPRDENWATTRRLLDQLAGPTG
jgi:hypothetical protein